MLCGVCVVSHKQQRNTIKHIWRERTKNREKKKETKQDIANEQTIERERESVQEWARKERHEHMKPYFNT